MFERHNQLLVHCMLAAEVGGSIAGAGSAVAHRYCPAYPKKMRPSVATQPSARKSDLHWGLRGANSTTADVFCQALAHGTVPVDRNLSCLLTNNLITVWCQNHTSNPTQFSPVSVSAYGISLKSYHKWQFPKQLTLPRLHGIQPQWRAQACTYTKGTIERVHRNSPERAYSGMILSLPTDAIAFMNGVWKNSLYTTGPICKRTLILSLYSGFSDSSA